MKTHKFERGEESKNSKEREGSKRTRQVLIHPLPPDRPPLAATTGKSNNKSSSKIIFNVDLIYFQNNINKGIPRNPSQNSESEIKILILTPPFPVPLKRTECRVSSAAS